MILTERDKSRFWAKVDKNGPVHPVLGTRCWLWTAYRKPNGYGWFRIRDDDGEWAMDYAHRVVLEIEVRALTVDEQGLHRCDNPSCVNYVEHLFIGTQAQNLADAGTKGHMARHVAGERHPKAKLTAADVAEIRSIRASLTTVELKGRRPGLAAELSDRFGISMAYVRRVWTGENCWKEG